MENPLTGYDLATVRTMRDRAWSTAVREWADYRAALVRGDDLTITNMLNASAWSAEHAWRSLYDECKARENAPTFGADNRALPVRVIWPTLT